MSTKRTVEKQRALPEAVPSLFHRMEDFDVNKDCSCIALRPSLPSRAGKVRAQLAKRGIAEKDVIAAISRVRSRTATI